MTAGSLAQLGAKMKKTSQNNLADFYDEDFYKAQVDDSLASGVKYAKALSLQYHPKSVIDIGCGRGTWLKAFKEIGAENLVGIDGDWNDQKNMVDQSIRFIGVDLNAPMANANIGRFDLAMSLEVAEHLEPTSAGPFVNSLTELSDVVMFGAAYTKQGGRNHINEQPHSYWAELFKERGYRPFDLFRSRFWGDKEIPFWYQQNTFLYVLEGSPLFTTLENHGHGPMENLAFLDCVHPELYGRYCHRPPVKRTKSALAKKWARKITPHSLRPLAGSVGRMVFKSRNG